jgi:hypothetical protein
VLWQWGSQRRDAKNKILVRRIFMVKKIAFLAVASLLIGGFLFAVPNYIPYSGRIVQSGRLINGTRPMDFGIYNAATNGTAVWSTASVSVQFNQGIYNVDIGPIDPSVLASDTLYLQVTINNEGLMPRTHLTSTPFALQAGGLYGANGVTINAGSGWAVISANYTKSAGGLIIGNIATANLPNAGAGVSGVLRWNPVAVPTAQLEVWNGSSWRAVGGIGGVPTPTITGFVPPTASVAGTLVTINGTNFMTGASVYFGSLLASSNVISSTVITASVPVGFVATSNLMVQNPAPNSIAGTQFGYFSTIGTQSKPATSCLAILNTLSGSPSGSYWLTVNNTVFQAYCDMSTDGGGWTKVVVIEGTNALHVNSASVGSGVTNNTRTTSAKFSDTIINAIKSTNGGAGTNPAFRIVCNGMPVFIPGSCAFNASGYPSSACMTAAYPSAWNTTTYMSGDDGDLATAGIGTHGWSYPNYLSVNVRYGSQAGSGCMGSGAVWSRAGSLWVK